MLTPLRQFAPAGAIGLRLGSDVPFLARAALSKCSVPTFLSCATRSVTRACVLEVTLKLFSLVALAYVCAPSTNSARSLKYRSEQSSRDYGTVVSKNSRDESCPVHHHVER